MGILPVVSKTFSRSGAFWMALAYVPWSHSRLVLLGIEGKLRNRPAAGGYVCRDCRRIGSPPPLALPPSLSLLGHEWGAQIKPARPLARSTGLACPSRDPGGAEAARSGSRLEGG